jgi:hypothetical protein
MASLARVASAIAFWFYRDTMQVRGQFTGANGSVGTILFKGLATVTRTGEGTYVFKLLAADGTSALKGFHLKNFNIFSIASSTADGLSGGMDWQITADAINAAGTINFTAFNAAGAAADIIAVAKMAVEISMEAAS